MKISFTGHKRLYKDVFGTDAGKKILHDLANHCYLTAPTIRKGEGQEEYFIREGKRQVILYILSNVEYDIEKYLLEREQYRTEIEHDR